MRTLMKFGCGWREISHKSKCRKDSESTFNIFLNNYILSYPVANARIKSGFRFCHFIII